MKQLIFILTLLLMCSHPVQGWAHKEFREVKALLKKKDARGALKEVERLASDSLLKNDAKRLAYGVKAYKLLLAAENEKMYLKQAYDTAGNFNYTLSLFEQILAVDSIERTLPKKKYREQHQKLLRHFFPNIKAGADYFYKKKKYSDAVRFLDCMIELPKTEIGRTLVALTPREEARAAYLCVLSMSEMGKPNGVLHYANTAMNDSVGRRNVRELTALSYLALDDQKNYEAALLTGLKEYPTHDFFFDRLSDFYLKNGRFIDACNLSDRMIKSVDDKKVGYWMTKSTAKMNLKLYDDAIDAGKHAIELNKDAVLMNFVVGASYCNLALAIQLPVTIHSAAYSEAISRQKDYYRQARPYLEAYRRSAPDNSESWAPLLYRVYLSLNMGKQFEEIEKFIK